MPATKPSIANDVWTDGNVLKVTEPSSGKKTAGWQSAEKPAFQYLNWLFYRATSWLVYLEDKTDELGAVISGEYEHIVGSGAEANRATLVDAIANASNGDAILVKENQTIGTTLVLSLNNVHIKFKQGVTCSNDSAGTGLSITGDRNKIEAGRWSGFTTAISIDAGADFNMLRDNYFAANTTEVSDASSTSDQQGSIYE